MKSLYFVCTWVLLMSFDLPVNSIETGEDRENQNDSIMEIKVMPPITGGPMSALPSGWNKLPRSNFTARWSQVSTAWKKPHFICGMLNTVGYRHSRANLGEILREGTLRGVRKSFLKAGSIHPEILKISCGQ